MNCVVFLDLLEVGIEVVVVADFGESDSHCIIEKMDMIRNVVGIVHLHKERNFIHVVSIDYIKINEKAYMLMERVYFIIKPMEHFVI